MISLNDYLYSGDTVLRIVQKYAADLERSSRESGNEVDAMHAAFLRRYENLLTHNDFLTSQSQRIREFYKYMTENYQILAFTFRGRIKSLIRTEEKFNGYVVKFIERSDCAQGELPIAQIQDKIDHFRDLIAYRIVISLPRCHVPAGKKKEEVEIEYLYRIASEMPGFLSSWGFVAQPSGLNPGACSPLLGESARPFFRDYVQNPKSFGYRSLHITFFDVLAKSYIEVQLRTQEMDDWAEIGNANHGNYERKQDHERTRRRSVPEGVVPVFDEAFERGVLLQQLDLSGVDVNMFSAADNHLMNDGCGLFRGRLILPYEHLSRFQNDIVG